MTEVRETYTRDGGEDPSSLAQLALEATKRVSSKLRRSRGALRSLERKAAQRRPEPRLITEEKEKGARRRGRRCSFVKGAGPMCG